MKATQRGPIVNGDVTQLHLDPPSTMVVELSSTTNSGPTTHHLTHTFIQCEGSNTWRIVIGVLHVESEIQLCCVLTVEQMHMDVMNGGGLVVESALKVNST